MERQKVVEGGNLNDRLLNVLGQVNSVIITLREVLEPIPNEARAETPSPLGCRGQITALENTVETLSTLVNELRRITGVL